MTTDYGGATGSAGHGSRSWRRFTPNPGTDQWHATGEAWTVVSTILSGICIFGGVGFGLDHLFGTKPVMLAFGLLAGTVLGVYLVYAKYFNGPDAQALPTVPTVTGWSKVSTVAGEKGEPHPPTPELANWPEIKRERRGRHAS